MGNLKMATLTDIVIRCFGLSKADLTKLDTFHLILDLINNISFECLAVLHSLHQFFIDDICTPTQQTICTFNCIAVQCTQYANICTPENKPRLTEVHHNSSYQHAQKMPFAEL